MSRLSLIAGGLLLGASSLAIAQQSPESILPPGFERPAPAPSPSAAPAPAASPAPATTSSPVVQDTSPSSGSAGNSSSPAARSPRSSGSAITLPPGFPSLSELERMSETELEEELGIRPQFDIPPAAQRKLANVGALDATEGGLSVDSLGAQPATLVRAALNGTRGPVVSRWGHILLRRALASRLEAPDGMRASEFATLRARVLNRIGEPRVARALLQDIDSANYTPSMAGEALTAALGTGDPLAVCPVTELQPDLRDDAEWRMATLICTGFSGDNAYANRQLNQVLSRDQAPQIDVLLAQRFAGVAGEGRRAVTIEWDGVDAMTDWRWGLASALGLDIPDELLPADVSRYAAFGAIAPARSLPQRAAVADSAGARGVLSSAAMVDLYSRIGADDGIDGDVKSRAATLRRAYVGETIADRVAAIRSLWGGNDPDYGRQVLTAHAAARLPVDDAAAADAGPLVASMLAAGLDRNAMRWADAVDDGSLGWALLALANPSDDAVDGGSVGDFAGTSTRGGAMLAAGLAGLGRLDDGDIADLDDDLSLGLRRQTRYARVMEQAGASNSQTLVVLLAGLGMQGESWERMTPLHLYHIVRALDRVGLSAEARMIAAEAVARA